ncbi:hypothetical protein GQ43DRAFT_434360 [Delitschia confertaspora ATCC 74209]|uniref:Uncharacterized protein n=1 Tax=Delitschia confertaspora ATCC 74209 TaxID=1513339 RepID=A0A9P4JJJ6_9PLEO|nr:hypothetical protein GQ43DRAFT_434360 [Delitschia confertaspora ATCC 74209]
MAPIPEFQKMAVPLHTRSRPPYAAQNRAMGGVPTIIPDVPITAVYLLLYIGLVFLNNRIRKEQRVRAHKFVFSGALDGLCKLRIITMSLRIAWACRNTSVSLAIAAQIFVYVGTVILLIMNWFFAQRVIRAQHQSLGWSTAYRILHRGGLGALICSLLMLIVASLQQSFSLDPNTLHIDRALQLTGLTYFASFCFATTVLVLCSLLLPRKAIDRFGEGRMRNNIAILIIGSTTLSVGAIFRCVAVWLPPTAVRLHNGTFSQSPWYFSTACFYIFNFTTEILVVILYILVRFDLRFHIPNGANGPGAYSYGYQGSFTGDYRDDRTDDGIGEDKKNYHIRLFGPKHHLKRDHGRPQGNARQGTFSTEGLYIASTSESDRSSQEPLQFPSTVLTMERSGNWKIKKTPTPPNSTSSRRNSYFTGSSSVYSRKCDSGAEDTPHIPALPDHANWPLRDSTVKAPERAFVGKANPNKVSRNRYKRVNEIEGHQMNGVDIANELQSPTRRRKSNDTELRSVQEKIVELSNLMRRASKQSDESDPTSPNEKKRHSGNFWLGGSMFGHDSGASTRTMSFATAMEDWWRSSEETKEKEQGQASSNKVRSMLDV